MLTTQGHLLGGRVSYSQPATGYRSGLEPVLLAAAVPARSGQHVLEAGTGAGAALLCLCARIDGIKVTGVEVDDTVAGLAASNMAANGFAATNIITGRIETVDLPGLFDHAIANPPYHLLDGSVSPLAERDLAKRGSHQMLNLWIERLSAALTHRGSLTLVVPAALVPLCLPAMMGCDCACTVVFPLWPKAGRPAKLVLLRGIKNARTPMRLDAGLTLHLEDGAFTPAAHAILTGTASLTL